PVLLRAFKGIDESYTLEIYGVGELLPQLEKLCEELNITQRVKFMGKSPEIYHHIRDCSLFVLTSDYEGMPNVLIEAMSMGITAWFAG
ncbi:MAG: glycosyltransferase, partial [Oscillospiraceae bacterium]